MQLVLQEVVPVAVVVLLQEVVFEVLLEMAVEVVMQVEGMSLQERGLQQVLELVMLELAMLELAMQCWLLELAMEMGLVLAHCYRWALEQQALEQRAQQEQQERWMELPQEQQGLPQASSRLRLHH